MNASPDSVTILPTDLWPNYEGTKQMPPPEDQPDEVRAFDRALLYEMRHRHLPEDFRQAYEMPARVHQWAEAESAHNLVLWGPVGSGKTYAAHAGGILRSVMRGGGYAWHTTSKFLRAAKDFDHKDETEYLRRVAGAMRVLAFDDIGRTKLTDFDVEVLSEVMDVRLGERRPTIITTNMDPTDELRAYLGEHLSSRLLGGAIYVHMAVEDRRKP